MYAKVAQLVEHHLAKVRVAGSSLVFRSRRSFYKLLFYFQAPGWWNGRHAGLKILWPSRLCGFESRPGYALFSPLIIFTFYLRFKQFYEVVLYAHICPILIILIFHFWYTHHILSYLLIGIYHIYA